MFVWQVSVTAGVNEMSLWTSFVSGLFGGPVYVALHYLVLKFKVDDPLDAVAVHLGGGIWGLLAASIFANNGLIFGDIYRASMLLANRVLGALAIFTWTVATCSIMFGILKALNLMRVTAEQELQGLDASLHREIGYPRSAWEPNFQIPETKLSPISSNKVKEGFGNQINLCRDRGLNPGTPAQKSDILPLDCQITIYVVIHPNAL
uniref:Ammonium transporter AmtB-like domain-containing protein n=1 Tax=Timema bartmani TaxID=61472 RepID=A0A7R9F7I1_9NEOP|nr:unnamed protein product [Timema bartmani]